MCEKSNGDQANGKEKKQQAHCGRASGSRTKVVQDHPALRAVSALRTRVGINPLCQEQSFVSGENLFLFLRPAYQTRGWGAGAQQETAQDPSLRTSAPSKGWGRSLFTYTFYVGSRSPRREYNISVSVLGVVLWAAFVRYVHWSGVADSPPLALVSHC